MAHESTHTDVFCFFFPQRECVSACVCPQIGKLGCTQPNSEMCETQVQSGFQRQVAVWFGQLWKICADGLFSTKQTTIAADQVHSDVARWSAKRLHCAAAKSKANKREGVLR